MSAFRRTTTPDTRAYRDPAEHDRFLRLAYRNWRPTLFGRLLSGAYALTTSLGLTSPILITLLTSDKKSGRQFPTVLVALEHEGHRYIVSMLGDGSSWVRNVRSSSGAAFIKRLRTTPVRLVELPVVERATVLKAWSKIATSGRRHLPVRPDAPLNAFEAIAADFPVFRIDPAEAKGADV